MPMPVSRKVACLSEWHPLQACMPTYVAESPKFLNVGSDVLGLRLNQSDRATADMPMIAREMISCRDFKVGCT